MSSLSIRRVAVIALAAVGIVAVTGLTVLEWRWRRHFDVPYPSVVTSTDPGLGSSSQAWPSQEASYRLRLAALVRAVRPERRPFAVPSCVARCQLARDAVDRAGLGLAQWGRTRPAVTGLEGNARVKLVKRILIAVVIVFAVFYVVTRPQDAASAVEGAVGAVWNATTAVGQFFTSLVT